MNSEPKVEWGPCCFCGGNIVATEVDPCSVQVQTAAGKWQVWFCHAACFRGRLPSGEEIRELIEPVHL